MALLDDNYPKCTSLFRRRPSWCDGCFSLSLCLRGLWVFRLLACETTPGDNRHGSINQCAAGNSACSSVLCNECKYDPNMLFLTSQKRDCASHLYPYKHSLNHVANSSDVMLLTSCVAATHGRTLLEACGSFFSLLVRSKQNREL